MGRFQNSSGTPISRINYQTYDALSCALDEQQAWKTAIDFMSIKMGIDIQICGPNPGQKLLGAIENRNGTIENLCDILFECKLYKPLSLLCTEPMQIIKQPNEGLPNNKLSVARGNKFSLEFDVFGLPLPTYIWYKDQEALQNQHSSELSYPNFNPELEGTYYCEVMQTLDSGEIVTLVSETVNVEVLPERCVITKKPFPEIYKKEGESIIFTVVVSGYPPPKYEWIHGNKVLQNFKGNEYFKLRCTPEDSGTYYCRIWNISNEIIIKTHLTVLDSGYLFPVNTHGPTEKVALLIGNQKYQHHKSLSTPENDVEALQRSLEFLGFLVIKKQNLGLVEMKFWLSQFQKMLVPDAYVVIYYGGHGFELGEKYLKPVDAPPDKSLRCSDCMNENQILRDVLEAKPKLFLFILDMCLERPDRVENADIYLEPKESFAYEPDRNLIQAYATSCGLRSHEIGNKTTTYNSVYVQALKGYIEEDLPILKILAKTNDYIQKVDAHLKQAWPMHFKQIPNISFTVSQDFCLKSRKQGDRWVQEIYKKILNHQQPG